MMASCAETGDEETTAYSVTLKNPGEYSYISSYSADTAKWNEKSKFAEGDTVYVYAGEKDGSTFAGWTLPTSVVALYPDYYNKNTDDFVFIMPATNVTLTATWTAGPVEPSTFNVTVINGTVGEVVDDEWVVDNIAIFAQGDPVYIFADDKEDSLFFKWTTSDGFSFYSDTLPLTSFLMPSKNVTVTATYLPDTKSLVRYTWKSSEQYLISSIDADYDAVEAWVNDVYDAEGYNKLDATAEPISHGSKEIPENIYSSTLKSDEYKGKYFGISEGEDNGWYTAICTVVDSINPIELGDSISYHIWDIVANYDVSVSEDTPERKYFEVGFDVLTFLEGEDDSGWIPEIRDNPYDNPRLEKSKATKLLKKVKKNNVTYYVFHRMSKNNKK